MGKQKAKVVRIGKTLTKEDRERLRLQTDLVGQEMSHLQDTGETQGRILRSRMIPPKPGTKHTVHNIRPSSPTSPSTTTSPTSPDSISTQTMGNPTYQGKGNSV